MCYPDIITIASVLASPHWQAIAADPSAENIVYTEIIRRLRGREDHAPFDGAGAIWPSSRHPLRYLGRRTPTGPTPPRPHGRWDALIAHLPQNPALFGEASRH